jgi:hypothetical protein
MTIKINEATVAIVQAYLAYAGGLVRDTMANKTYGTMFKDINDDLVIKPEELITFVNQVQRALSSVGD